MPPGCFYNLLSGHRVEFVPKFFQFVCSVDLFNDVSTSIITTFNKDAVEITGIGIRVVYEYERVFWALFFSLPSFRFSLSVYDNIIFVLGEVENEKNLCGVTYYTTKVMFFSHQTRKTNFWR